MPALNRPLKLPRQGARSYRWVKYAIESNKVVPLRQREAAASNDQLAA